MAKVSSNGSTLAYSTYLGDAGSGLGTGIAADSAEAIYTDVWTSMGQEAESIARKAAFKNFQINSELMKLAHPNALVMHCLPAYRGKEIDEETFEANAETIFDQAENRLHAQKALLLMMLT